MDCPRDSGVEMDELSAGTGEVLFRCGECGSLWIDSGELTRALLHNNLPGLETLGGRENLGESAGMCPEDLTDLVVIEAPKNHGHSYAMCEVCGGVWLTERADGEPFQGDTGDEMLQQVIDFFHAFGKRD